MIQIIYGKKGTGKSKKLVELANHEAEHTHGHVVFLDDDSRVMYSLKHEIRFIDITSYHVNNEEKLFGFISGIMAGDYDISAIYMDGMRHIIEDKLQSCEKFFRDLAFVLSKSDIKFIMIISGEEKDIPDFIRDYIVD